MNESMNRAKIMVQRKWLKFILFDLFRFNNDDNEDMTAAFERGPGVKLLTFHGRIPSFGRRPINGSYGFTLTLHKSLVQKRFARFISGHQGTSVHFQDLTVCSIRFRPWKCPTVPCWPNLNRFERKFYATLGFTQWFFYFKVCKKGYPGKMDSSFAPQGILKGWLDGHGDLFSKGQIHRDDIRVPGG